MKEVVITGASGFLGQHLVAELQKDPDIHIKKFQRGQHSLDDIKSLRNLVEDSDVIFHLAGLVSSKNPGELERVNVFGTQNLVTAMQAANPNAQLIFASTFAVYKTPQKGDLITEDYQTEQRNKYGQTKLSAENLIRAAGINYSILRFANVYGPGIAPFRHSVIATWFDAIKSNKEIIIDGDGSQTRDFIFVDDAVAALIAARDTQKILANVCSGEETSLKELLNKMGEVSGVKPNIKYREGDPASGGYWHGSFDLVKKEIGWGPNVNLIDGLKLTWKAL